MNKFGALSVALLLITNFVFWTWFFTGEDFLPKFIMMFIVWILPVIGLISAFLSKNRTFKVVGILGNSLVILFSILLPAASTLFWNQP